jgi:hypothetical protein
MENFNNSGESDIFRMEIDDHSKSLFLEMTRWTKFLAILGFIFLGLILIGGIFVGMAVSKITYSPLAGIGSAGVIMIYVVIAAVNFYPTYALLKYSTAMKAALHTNSKQKFIEAVSHLKNFFKFFGILMVISLCLYGLIIVFSIIAAALNR